MTGIIKTDQLQSAQSSTITIPSGNKISIIDSATIGTLNAATVKGVTTFEDSSVFSGATSFSGTVSGDNNHMVKVYHSTWTSNVSQVLANSVFTSDYLHYKVFMRVQPTANSVITIYLTTGGGSPADAVNMSVYQGDLGNRGSAGGAIGTSIAGSNAYLAMPTNNNIYGNADCFAELTIFNAVSGAVSGTTNVTPKRRRAVNYFNSQQNVASADNHGFHGWGFFQNNTATDNPTVTGLKFAPNSGNWAKGEITIYGFKV